MASVINTNIAATRTHNVYNRNTIKMNEAMTNVATGMRINSAKDGASTWAISEKMRERIRANDQANQNIQNDTAMLKTAQGGIGNTIDILTTLKERVINALNDSNINSDRGAIGTEVLQLVNQIDDNAAKVKFNGRTLLNGDTDNTVGTISGVETKAGVTFSSKVATMSDTATEFTNAVYEAPTAVKAADWRIINDSTGKITSTATSTKLVDLVNSTANANTNKTDSEKKIFKEGDTITLSFTVDGGDPLENTITVGAGTTIGDLMNGLSGNGATVMWNDTATQIISPNAVKTATNGVEGSTWYNAGGATPAVSANNSKTGAGVLTIIGDQGKVLSDVTLTVSGEEDSDIDRNFFLTKLGLSSTTGFNSTSKVYVDPDAQQSGGATTDLTFYIGGEANFGMDISINKMTTGTLLGTDAATFAGYFTSKESLTSNNVLDTIDKALATAMTEQTKLGAYESRLGYASDNLVTMNENLEAADSAMRDSDIAKEMTSYMKYAVLSQASQYMLAQAGQNAFQVLNLLQQ